jgi:N-acetylglucosaminyldiphosphoundecaprenol N-acetyl-beta-D-mannosaminyltransferase
MLIETDGAGNLKLPLGGPPQIPTEIIGGVSVATLTRKETASRMVAAAIEARGCGGPALVCSSVNGQVLSEMSLGSHKRRLVDQMQQAYIVNADGQPFVFASRLLGGRQLTERCATTDLFHDVAEIAPTRGVSFFMLGASPDENKVAVENVRRQYPDLQIVGSRHGYFLSPAEEAAAVQEINDLKPDIVWIAMGFPRELDFCMRWRHALNNVGVMKTSGGLFNFLSGTNPRAPSWMQAAGLEWAYRLYLEPRRLFVRYATTNVVAMWLLLTRTKRS